MPVLKALIPGYILSAIVGILLNVIINFQSFTQPPPQSTAEGSSFS